jgi:5-formyltetrahydrofolate cyclo-ligase
VGEKGETMSHNPLMSEHKSGLRVETRALRRSLERPDFTMRLARFAHLLELAPRSIVAGYYPVRDEADPRGLMNALIARGHRMALPRVAQTDAPLHFHRWRAADPLCDNPQGIAEPLPEAERVEPDMILVPLLAFDAAGYRLGHGGGYYDRTLAGAKAVSVGIAYAGQQRASIPLEAHDIALDHILTENGLFTPA